MIDTSDIPSYADNNIPYNIGKRQSGLEKYYERHFSNFLNGSTKISWKLTKKSAIYWQVLAKDQSFRNPLAY